jgi:hypothetical protein
LDEDIFSGIDVYRARNGHILLSDPTYPLGKPPNQYFDLHEASLRVLKPDVITFSVSGQEKTNACEIYLHWKYRENQSYVKKKASEIFPVNEVRNICQTQKVKQLCHFTHSDNLSGILELGLVGQDKLSGKSKVRFNDDSRRDGFRQAVCLSISFPNYKMFNKYSQDSRADWAVITLQPEILWELDCAFCLDNAASNNVRGQSLAKRKHFSTFASMFQDFGSINRKDLGIPGCFTTNPQAEVLVFGEISPKYILKVCFYHQTAKNEWFQRNSISNPDLLEVEAGYFTYRCDYQYWPSIVDEQEVEISF